MNRLPAASPDAIAASERLCALIRTEIDAHGGWLTFDRYMELALYAPGLGYYAAGAHKLGDSAAGGDFVTAPELSPLFGRALAAQVAQLFAHCAPRVLEFGAGSGALAAQLLDALAALGRPAERYAIVEVSADLADRQRTRLAGRPVDWLAAPPADFEGAIVANEVLDVLPVKLFAKRGAATLARGVVWREDRFAFADRPADDELAAAVAEIESATGALPDGYVSEVGLAARAWARTLPQWLARGAALLVDYGFPRAEYYHPQRIMGTIMCHYRHHAHADPFWLPGLNDLTAHVDFSAIAQSAHEAGLDVRGYTSQAHFLLNCGLAEALRSASAADKAAAHRLISEAEMGELFKVLAVGRGIDAPLLGFARGDRRHRL
ncbi:MAG: class I SAM-dependent methyltransferase [Betaproteobacteria bacterium]